MSSPFFSRIVNSSSEHDVRAIFVTDVSKGKSSSLFLTEEGKDIYEISSEIFMLHHEMLLSVFLEEEREVLHRMMIKMDEVLDEMLS